MRTGAIFARGSCSALKWMALVSVVFALGAGSAVAQVAIGVKSVTVVEKGAGDTVEEGALLTVRVTLDKRVPRSSNDTPGSATVTLTEGVPSGALAAMGNAEANDVTLPGDTGAGITVAIPEQADTGTLNIVTGRDLDAVDEKFRLSAAVTAVTGATEDDDGNDQNNTVTAAAKTFDGKIVDAQDQVYELKLKTAARDVKEGSTFEVTLRAVPDRPENEDVNVFLQMSDTTNYTLDADGNTPDNMRTLNEETANVLHTVEITAKANDENRTDDTLMIEAFTGEVGRSSEKTELSITVLDMHRLPDADAIEAEARDNKTYADGMMVTSVAEGGTAYVWVEVTNTTRDAVSDDEEFTVSLMAADQNQLLDYRVSPSSYKTAARGGFTSSGDDTERVGPFTLEALSDEDIGEEELMLYVHLTGQSTTYGDGESNGMFSITIEDTTKPMVWAKSQEDIEAAVYGAKGEGTMSPGDSFELMTSDLFMMAEGVTVAYSASSDGDAATASASASMVTVTAVAPGMAHVTVTATASMAAGAMAVPQTVSNIAQVVFPVTVELSELSVMVAADPMEIMEGGVSTITATASRMVETSDGDVTVDLQVVGDGTLSAESITIAAGSDSGSVTLTATEDDDDYDDETLTVIASGAASTTIEVAVTDNDMVPPETTYTLTASADMVTEGGDAVTITATASAAVAADTMIDLVHGAGSASADDYSLEPMMITIAAGGTSGMAMLTATANDGVEGDETLTLEGRMGNMVVGSVMLTIADTDVPPEPPEPPAPTVRAKDDAATMIADAIATAAGGADWMVGGMVATVDMSTLFDVDDGVTAVYAGKSSDDSVVSATVTGGSMLALTPMGAGMATIEVTGTDTAGGGTDTVMHDAAVVLQTLSVMVTASATAVDEGGMVTLTAEANRAVTEATTITLTLTGDTAAVAVEPAAITIAAGSDSGTATVTAVEDDDAADANVAIVATGPGMTPTTINIAIKDNDPTVSGKSDAEVTAVFTTAVAMAGGASGWLPGGGAAEVDMSALFTTNGSPTLEYTAKSSAEDTVGASASGSMLTLTPMATGDATISVTATDTGGDAADTATVSAMVTVGVLPLEIMVSPTTAEVEEGGTVEITATANKMVDRNVEVMLLPDVTGSTAGEDDYSLAPSAMITIMAGEVSGMATLTATDDYEVEGNESVTLVAREKDMGDIGTVMVSIMDNDMETTYTLSGPMDMNIVEGQSYELTATANQAVHMDTEVMLVRDRAASDAGDDDYTVGSITIAAGATSGTTMLMVTADDMPDGGTGTNMGEKLVLVGSVDGMEIGTLEFIVWDAAVPALPVIAQLLLAALLGLGGYRRYLRRR